MSEHYANDTQRAVAELKQENANLRDQLAASNSLLECERRTHAACAERAEAFEAKLKALDEQEPVAYLNLAVWKRAGYDTVYATPERAFSNQDALYAAPIPPADVQELQRTIEKLREGVTTIPEYMQMVQEQRQRIAELERKLAEQQAKVKKLHEFVRGTELEPEMNGEELNTLLAQAREEGRREAVPEGIVSIDAGFDYQSGGIITPTLKLYFASGTDSNELWIARDKAKSMLSAAHPLPA